ncbi:hypothetical protein KIN20_012737 [Parelaphostrongylus tenuis]|uniref:Uncharacterized protein n=1 Tax=Parelaphostrongylus tenuis TaxID=148309 RepID=A0AAD5QNC0_PARTN|nr:hypothetical protein KIN20_012737 [Parelaphostrongylus tenuis]
MAIRPTTGKHAVGKKLLEALNHVSRTKNILSARNASRKMCIQMSTRRPERVTLCHNHTSPKLYEKPHYSTSVSHEVNNDDETNGKLPKRSQRRRKVYESEHLSEDEDELEEVCQVIDSLFSSFICLYLWT